MWKLTTLVLAFAISIPTAHAETVDALTIAEIQQDDTLLDITQAIYFIGQQSETDADLILDALDDFTLAVESSGQALDAETLHGLCQDLAWQLRDDLGDALAGQLLSRDAMAPFKMSITESDPDVWIADVADLGLDGMFSYTSSDDPEPEAATSWEDIGSKLGAALGAVGGFAAGGGPGAAVGGALGYGLGGMLGAAADEAASGDDDDGGGDEVNEDGEGGSGGEGTEGGDGS